jgi:hypothetical protein
MKRSMREKIFEAERQLHEGSLTWLRHELETLRRDQQKSLEPEGYETLIAEIERKLANPQAAGLRDLWAYLLCEKDERSWQQIGDQLYPNVEGKRARRSRARRAWERADCMLEAEPRGNSLADVINAARMFPLFY